MKTTCSLRKLFGAFALIVVTLFSPLASAGQVGRGVRGAVHRGVVEGDSIVWRSQFHLEDGERALRLASPLPIGSRVEEDSEVTVIEENGKITGFSSTEPNAPSLAVVIHEPFSRTKDHVHLDAPLAEGDAVQIIDVGGPGGLHFEPLSASSLERRVGYYAYPGFAKRGRAERDASLAYRKNKAGDLPLYVRATPELASGIDGTLTTEQARTRTGAIGAGVIFVGMIAALGVAYRRFADAARFEQAERTLEEEFLRLNTYP